MASTVILASGGINSTVAAARAKQEGDIHLLHIDYGQKPADPQRAAVRMIADSLGGDFTSLELPHVNAIATLKKQTGAGASREQNLRQQTTESVSQIPSLITVMIGMATQLAHRVGASAIHVGTSELPTRSKTRPHREKVRRSPPGYVLPAQPVAGATSEIQNSDQTGKPAHRSIARRYH